MSFNMGSAIGDIAWSPYSATIFAAVTDDGSARVYDLSQNDSEPLCEQKLVAKTGLARVAFNPRLDIMLIGDDRSAASAKPCPCSFFGENPSLLNMLLEMACPGPSLTVYSS